MDSPRRSREPRSAYSNHEDGKRDRYSPDRREGRTSSKHEYYERRDRDRDNYNDYRSKPYKDDYESKSRSDRPRVDEYRSLALSSLPSQMSDSEIKESLYHEFRKFGDFGVKVTYMNDHRIAYVNFRDPQDARDARHYKSKLVIFDKPVHIEPVFTRSRKRSPSPSEYDSRTRNRQQSRSPYSDRSHDNGPPLPPANLQQNDYPDDLSSPPRGQGQNGDYGFGRDFRYPHHLKHVCPEEDPSATRTLFIGNLDYSISDGEIRHIFSRYGLIEDIDIKRPPKGMGNAYAFLRYINLDCAHDAKVDMSGKYIGKFQCKIGYGKVSPSNCLWIGGIGPWVKQDDLGNEFSRYGPVTRIQWPPGKTFCYIMFDNQECASQACQEMRGFTFGGPNRKIRVDFADPIHMEATYQNIVISENGPSYTTDFRETRHKIPEYRNEYKGGSQDNRPKRDDYNDRKRSRDETRDDHGHDSKPSTDRTNDDQMSSPDSKKRRDESKGRGENGHARTKEPKSLVVADKVDNLMDLAKCLPVVWTGALVLKNSAFPSRMHLVSGEMSLVDTLMKDGLNVPLLKITQRLRLEASKLDEVTKKVDFAGTNGYCVLLAMPMSNHSELDDSTVQQRPLRNLVTYLKQKEAAGVTNLPLGKKTKENEGVLHTFPPCDFGQNFLLKRSPNLGSVLPIEDHLVVIVVRGPP